jgi:hypothetical protein
MVKHLLELRGRFLAVMGQQVGLPAKVNGVQHPYLKRLTLPQLIGRCSFQELHRPDGILSVELDGSPDRG